MITHALFPKTRPAPTLIFVVLKSRKDEETMTEFEEGAIKITIIIVGGASDETTRIIK